LHTELDAHLIGRVVHRPELGDQAPRRGGDGRGGVLKGLVGLFYQGGVILQPTYRRTRGQLVDLDNHAAALIERKLNETLHGFPPRERIVTGTLTL